MSESIAQRAGLVFTRIQLFRHVLGFSYIGSLSLVVIKEAFFTIFSRRQKRPGLEQEDSHHGTGELLITALAVATTQIQ